MPKVFSISASIAQASLLGIMFIASLVPLAQMEIGIFKDRKLGGVQNKVKKPKISRKAFTEGEFQKEFDQWFTKNLGFRGPAVRSENQLNFSLFGDMSSKSSSNIVLGRDNFLFELAYIHSYNRNYPMGEAVINNVADKLRTLQLQLKQKLGVAFALVITPSKPEIYPEMVPDSFIHPSREKRVSDYEIFKRIAPTKGLNVVDGVEISKKLKEETGYFVFAPGGVHWGYWTACEVGNEVINSLEQQMGKSLQKLDCGPAEFRDRPFHADRDLLNLANLWDESFWARPVPYPNLKKMVYNPESYHPTVLMVGDSFAWNPLRFFDKDAIFRKRKFLYYYSTEYNFWTTGSVEKPKKNKSKKNHKGKIKLDWKTTFSDRDAVVIFVNQSVLHSTGLGFLDDALAWLSSIEE